MSKTGLWVAVLAVLLAGPISADGLREGEREMLERIRQKEADRYNHKRFEYDRDVEKHVGYSDRKKIRSLENRKHRLQDQLQRRKPTYGQASSIRAEIRGIDKQIMQIRGY